MLKVFSLLVAVSLLGGCYTQFKASKQVDKALAHYPELVAKIALDSFPCDIIRIDTIISVNDTTIEINYPNYDTSVIDTVTKKLYVKLPYKTIYITKVVESIAKLTIINSRLDSSAKVITDLQKTKEELTAKVKRKNRIIYWLLAFIFAMSIPYVIRILNMLTIKI